MDLCASGSQAETPIARVWALRFVSLAHYDIRMAPPVRTCGAIALLVFVLLTMASAEEAHDAEVATLSTESLPNRTVWVDPKLEHAVEKGGRVRATIWFREQFLGDGRAYARRAREFAKAKRTELRTRVIATLKLQARSTWERVEKELDRIQASDGIRNVDRYWIVNGFSCGVTAAGLTDLRKVGDVGCIFLDSGWRRLPPPQKGESPNYGVEEHEPFDVGRYKHPWYVRSLLADKVWQDFGVTGRGTLNVVHDHNFVFSPNVTKNVYRNQDEIPGNGKDDDNNGLVDDYHGFNFNWNNHVLTTIPVPPDGGSGAELHGFTCGAIICGTGAEDAAYEFGLAPEGRWAGVISGRRMEASVQWAIEQGADTYSMSFSVPDKGEHRSHWRKVMEHGAFCGVCFVSGAGNFALQQKKPVQMRQPEDVPNAVFAAAGVRRDLSRTPTSSQGPVEWNTQHYRDGEVAKPAVCAFNFGLPRLFKNGTVTQSGLNGNSFAGPMFCGAIALMLSADPDLLPWDLREIITETATDVADKGVDHQTGHGLINCFRAVKEVLRRKAIREGTSPKRYTGREKGDELDVRALKRRLKIDRVVVGRLGPKGQARALGIQVGDRLISYNKKTIHTRADLRAAIKGARKLKTAINLVVSREKETLTFALKPGRIGIGGVEVYNQAVFE